MFFFTFFPSSHAKVTTCPLLYTLYETVVPSELKSERERDGDTHGEVFQQSIFTSSTNVCDATDDRDDDDDEEEVVSLQR